MVYYTLLLFLFSSVLLTISPGPDILFVISSSLAKGWRKGIQLTLGLTCGILIYTSVVVLGVGSMLNAYPQVLRWIEIAGGFYLIFLAIRLLKSASKTHNSENKPQTKQNLFLTGLIMNLSNPKVGLFFLSFFPGFLFHNSWSFSKQFMVLGIIFYLQALFIFSLCAIVADHLGKKLGNSVNTLFWNRVQALVLIFIALILVYP